MSFKNRLNYLQNKALKNILVSLSKEQNSLLVMPTGTGKTRLAIRSIKKGNYNKVLWITQGEELIQQTHSSLCKYFGKKKIIGIIQQDNFSINSDIVVASIQTLTKDDRLARINSDHFDLIIIDECHHAMANTWLKVLNHFDNSKKLGLTATPFRMDGDSLDSIFKEICFELDYLEAEEKRVIAKAEVHQILSSNILANFKPKPHKDYSIEEQTRVARLYQRSRIIVESYKKIAIPRMRKLRLKRKTICFCVDIQHAIDMAQLFRDEGFKSEVLVSNGSESDRDRFSLYEDFKNTNKIEIICVVNILNEGKDIPEVGCILMGRPTTSAIIYLQQLGRGTRFVENRKESFLLLDFVDNIEKDFVPFTFPRFTGSSYERPRIHIGPEILNLDFPEFDNIYKNKEDYQFNIQDNVSKFRKKFIYNKDRFDKAVLKWYSINGKISHKDFKIVNKMPSRRDLIRHYGTLKNCIQSLGLNQNLRNNSLGKMAKKSILEKGKSFYKNKGSLSYVDIKNKNGFPSHKTIRKIFGNMRGYRLALHEEYPEIFSKKWALSRKSPSLKN